MTEAHRSHDQAERQPIARTEIVDLAAKPGFYKKLWKEIYDLERDANGDNAFDAGYLWKLMNNPETMTVLLRRIGDDKILGYTCGIPDEDEKDGKSAYIDSTAILKDFQGKGLVAPLIDALEDEMKRRGFEYMTRDSMNQARTGADGRPLPTYADVISKLEGHQGRDRIVESQDVESPHGPEFDYGAQRHFKIDIRKGRHDTGASVRNLMDPSKTENPA